VISVADAQSTLSNIADELRALGGSEGSKYVDPVFKIANSMDKRAIEIGKRSGG
jgi:hypothetical protein